MKKVGEFIFGIVIGVLALSLIWPYLAGLPQSDRSILGRLGVIGVIIAYRVGRKRS